MIRRTGTIPEDSRNNARIKFFDEKVKGRRGDRLAFLCSELHVVVLAVWWVKQGSTGASKADWLNIVGEKKNFLKDTRKKRSSWKAL